MKKWIVITRNNLPLRREPDRAADKFALLQKGHYLKVVDTERQLKGFTIVKYGPSQGYLIHDKNGRLWGFQYVDEKNDRSSNLSWLIFLKWLLISMFGFCFLFLIALLVFQ